MATKEQILVMTARLNAAGAKAEAFIAGGGDFGSTEGIAIGMELLHAFNDLSTEFGHPILKKIEGN